MKIAVIAANGRAGQAFVKASLAGGYKVRAGVHSQNNLPASAGLEIIKCDATSSTDIKKLVSGCDAVVSLIGHTKNSTANVQTDAIQRLTQVLLATGPKRIISLTGTGVRFEGDKITLIDRFLNLGVSVVDPKRVNDGKAAAEILKNSELEWTIIRVLKLQNLEPKPFKLSQTGPTKPFVGRQEVAQAILEVIKSNSFIKQAPIICRA